jgi:1-acyl-sn-glycerol-3-phosphate acyltransferase
VSPGRETPDTPTPAAPGGPGAEPAGAPRATVRQAAARTASKKAATSKAATSKATAKKATAKKGTAKKGTAKKSVTSPTAVQKATAKKASTTAAMTQGTATPGATTPGDATSPRRGVFAAGAARATGERLRRSGTPLLSGGDALEPVEVSAARRLRLEQATETPDVPEAIGPDAQAPSGPPLERDSETGGWAPEAVPEVPRTRPSRSAIHARRTESASRAAHPTAVPPGSPGTSGSSSGLPGTPGATASRARTRPPRRVPLTPTTSTTSTTSTTTTTTASTTPTGPSAEEAREATRLRAVPPIADAEGASDLATTLGLAGLQSKAERLVGAVLEAAEFSSESRPGPAELVELAVNVFRAAATSAGLPAEDVERQVAETLAYLRRRLTGDYTVDEFGFDEDYTVHVHLPLLRPLYRSWFRVEVRGIENIPSEGGALVVGNHSGTVAMDSLMTQVAVFDEHPQHRHLRMLGADLVFQLPFIGTMARRSGTTLAANTDAERLLAGGSLVGVWPEGFKGVGKPFSERYKLQRFGRGGFVSAALRAGVPIVPVSIVGAEEIYPILGNMPAVARLLGLPYAPITPTFPLLGPLGMIPLPSKWLIEFGPPIDTTSFGPDAADDPMLVFDLTDQVRETIQQTLYSLLMQRKSVFI